MLVRSNCVTVHGVVRAGDGNETLRLARPVVGVQGVLRGGHRVIEWDDHEKRSGRDSLDEGGGLVFVIKLPGPHGYLVAPVLALLRRSSGLIADGLAVVGKGL